MLNSDVQNATATPLPTGYLTGEFAIAEQSLAGALSDQELLNLLLLADAREEDKHNHRTPPPDDWKSLRDEIGVLLMRRLTGGKEDPAHQNWRDPDANWHERKFADALRSLPKLDEGGLLTLFIQASENAFLFEGGPMQARWEKVASQCRAEIFQRLVIAKSFNPLELVFEADDEDDAEGEEEYVSLRQVLRVAEDAYESKLSDAKLLDLYVLVENCGAGPDDEIFDEILDPIAEMVERRMLEGTPDPELHGRVPGFDYPDHHADALKAVLTGRLPHKNLLTIYWIAWDCETESPWISIADLCRAQILRRMRPPPPPPADRHWDTFQDWKRTELVRRVRAHDDGGADETEA